MQTLHRQGLSQCAISTLTGHDRKTVRKYLAHATLPQYGPRAPRPSKLAPFSSRIDAWCQQGMWNAVVVLEKLRALGYTGGYTMVKDYLHPKRNAAHVQAVRRFETAPGQQAQVDWGDLGSLTRADGLVVKLYLFEMVLGFSRAAFRAVATDMTLPTLLRLHEEAFRALGGVCRTILYDHMKTVVLGLTDAGEPHWQPDFQRFTEHYGYVPRLCQPYRAQTKGKVESGVGFVRKNFLCGREATSVADLDSQLRVWTAATNQRVHGTTHRVVADAWKDEQAALCPVAGVPSFALVSAETRQIARDAYMDWRSNRYSVPWAWAGDRVCVREGAGVVDIRHGDDLPISHSLCLDRYQVITDPAHHRGMPFGPGGRSRQKARLQLRERVPAVEQRTLASYATFAEVGG